jgi:eukaryotic-like serine/threonine-protein kinase
VVIALAWWVGANVLSVAGSVDEGNGSTPSAGAPAQSPTQAPAAGTPVPIVSASVFDPEGDGQPENDRAVPLAYDGDPATAWSTLTYRGSPAFGNLKSGVGLLLDLGSSQSLSGITVGSTRPGATVEIRTGDQPASALNGFTAVASGTVEDSTDLAFDKPVTARFVLVWVTGLVDGSDGFSADLAEVVPQSAS